jgi:aldehyde:ferredoxin oxidoreductase
MNSPECYGYQGNILRVDLSGGKAVSERLDDAVLKKYIGGACLGIKLLYDEVPPGVAWNDRSNRLFIGSGPLGGTRIEGSGTIAVVTKGALTNGTASSQANGFFGAYLRSSGFDAIVVQGASDELVYLHIHDGMAEIKRAGHLAQKDTYTAETAIKEEIGEEKRGSSVVCIGPAGENGVRFASMCADMGHVAAHNGVGAVMGSKRLKAIVVSRGKSAVPLKDHESLSSLAKELRRRVEENKFYHMFSQEGTVGGVFLSGKGKTGLIPIKNYTTNVCTMDPDRLDGYSSQHIRANIGARPTPCWACSSHHCQAGKISHGKYAGRTVEEPEFEAMGAWSTLVGIDDVATSVAIANEVDRLGMDTNEAGWLIAWLMECYEKGILSKRDLDGVEMTWGNDDAIMAMLHRIARRRGFGNVLAEGVMRASQQVGGEAPEFAIHTLKGNTPRTHDHRIQWLELFDTSVSNLGSLETHNLAPFELLGMPSTYDAFDPQAVSTVEAKIKGAMVFEDSLVTCRFRTGTQLDLLSQAVNAATGWDMDFQEAMTVGRRAVNLARAFNLRHGIGGELDRPSMRYGSTPSDGVAAGRSIMARWDEMLDNYYDLMGWNEQGVPLPHTLRGLGLGGVIPELWPKDR